MRQWKKWIRTAAISARRSRRTLRLSLEPLEDRYAPATLTPSLPGGNLVIADGGNVANAISLVVSGTNLVVSDAVETFSGTGGISGATLSNGNKTLTVPLSSIPGSNITFDGGGGSDTLTIDHSGGAFGKTINSTATNIVFNLPATANNAILGDDGVVGNGVSRLSGATFELTDFVNPTGSITINRGSASDTVTVNALPDCNASLTLGAAASPFNAVTLAGAVTLGAGKDFAAFATGTIALPNATSDLATSGSGAIALTTARGVAMSAGASLVTVNGNLTIDANQQTSATTGNFIGVNLNGGATIRSTGSGNVTVRGRGGNDAAGNQWGVILQGTGVAGQAGVIEAAGTGNVVVTGTGGASAGNGNIGVVVQHVSAAIAAATGSVTVTGTSNATSSSANSYGVEVFNGGTIIAGGSGVVIVTGAGAVAAGGNNYGVTVSGASAKIASTNGAVLVDGTGRGSGTSIDNYGLYVHSGGKVLAEGTGGVNVLGTGGVTSGNSNVGVFVVGTSSAITSSGGNVQVTGAGGGGGGTSNANIGVSIGAGGLISSGGMGTLQIGGTGGAGPTSANYGVWLNGTNARITSAGGAVTITGQGGSGTERNRGIFVESGGQISSGGMARLTVTGTGGSGTSHGHDGVRVEGATSLITSNGGDVYVTGTGGGTGAATDNSGVTVNAGQISAGGTGDVTVDGTGGNTSGGNLYGVAILGSGTITSSGGDVWVTGTSRGTHTGTTFNNIGIFLNAGTITAGSMGTVTVVGTGNSATTKVDGNTGVYLIAASILSGGGAVSVMGNATASNSHAIALDPGSTIASGGTASLTITADTLFVHSGASPSTLRGGAVGAPAPVIVQTLESAIPIALGGSDVTGGSRTLGLAVAELGRIIASTLTVGRYDGIASGTLTVAAALAPTYNLTLLTGAGVAVGETIAMAANKNLVVTAGGEISMINGTSDLTATGTGTISIATARNVTMTHSGASITTVNGSLTVDANQQTAPTSGNFTGIQVNTSTIRSTGSGTVTVRGRGGDHSSGSQFGVYVTGAAFVTSTGGSVSLVGQGGGSGSTGSNHGIAITNGAQVLAGGAGTSLALQGSGGVGSGNSNFGVLLRNSTSTISSTGGNVSVTGTGGGTGTSASNRGVSVEIGADLQAGGAGTTTVVGTGGGAAGNDNVGVYVAAADSFITSAGGSVSVTGTGGGSGVTSNNFGVYAIGTIGGATSSTTIRGFGGNTNGGGVSQFGVWIDGSSATLSSNGATLVEGTGGGGTSSGGGNYGLFVSSGGTITSNGTSAAATVTVRGFGGNFGTSSLGTHLADANSKITSNGGPVLVEGTGGSGPGGTSYGVEIRNGAAITSAGTGAAATVTVKGFGGAGAGNSHYGVYVNDSGSTISSSGGAVLVEGTGGGTGTSALNHGVLVFEGGVITSAAAAATVTVKGQGGPGTGNANYGVYVLEPNSRIASAGGNIEITGTGGGSTATSGGSTPIGIIVQSGGQVIGSAGTATVTLIADSMNLLTATSIASGSNRVNLRPKTAGTLVNLGGADVFAGSPRTLGLTDAELDTIAAGSLYVNVATTGTMTVSDNISRSANTYVDLQAVDILLSGGSIDTGGGDLNLAPITPGSVKPTKTGVDVVAGLVYLSSGRDLTIDIAGPTFDSQFSQLKVVGTANLNFVDLILTGAYLLAPADVLEIVKATSRTNTFNGLAENATIPFGLQTLQVNYTPTGATLKLAPSPVTVTPSSATPIEGAPVTFTATIPGAPNVGTVTFYAGPGLTNPIDTSVAVVNGSATSAAIASLPIGAHSITAVYSGGAGFGAGQGTAGVNVTGSLVPSLDGSGNLVLADLHSTGRNNGLTMVVSGADLVVTETATPFSGTGGIAGAVLSNSDHTLTIPLASITGSAIAVNAAGGNDTLTVNLAGGSIGKTINYGGGQRCARHHRRHVSGDDHLRLRKRPRRLRRHVELRHDQLHRPRTDHELRDGRRRRLQPPRDDDCRNARRRRHGRQRTVAAQRSDLRNDDLLQPDRIVDDQSRLGQRHVERERHSGSDGVARVRIAGESVHVDCDWRRRLAGSVQNLGGVRQFHLDDSQRGDVRRRRDAQRQKRHRSERRGVDIRRRHHAQYR